MADTPLGEVILKNVRLSFADLFKPGKPQRNDNGEMVPGKYKANLLIPKKGHDDFDPATSAQNIAKIKAAADQVKEAKWGSDPKKHPKLKPDQVCLRDGNLENWAGYEDCFYVSANNQNQPVLVDRKKDSKGKWLELTIENGGPKLLYSGAFVNAIVRLWAQEAKDIVVNGNTIRIPNRINAGIESVQFLRHGESFSGGAPVDPNGKFDDDFGDEEDLGDGDADDDSGLI